MELLEKVVGITAAVIGVIALIFLYPMIVQQLVAKEPEAPTPPVAIISAMQDSYVGEELSFSAAESMDPDGRIIDHQWDFGDGQRGFGPKPVHAYQSPGDYKVTLTVIDDDQKNSVAQATVKVLPRPVVEEAPKPVVQEALEPAGAEATVEAKCDNKSDNWCYRILDASISKQMIKVGDEVEITAIIGQNQTGKNNLIISLDVTGPDSAEKVPSRIIDTEEGKTYPYSIRLSPKIAGEYKILLEIKDVDDNMLDSRNLEFVVANPPQFVQPTADISFSPIKVYVFAETQFSAANSSDEDGRIVRYVWSFGDGNTAYGRQVNHIFLEPGNYNVVLIVTDDDGLKGSSTVTISVLKKTG